MISRRLEEQLPRRQVEEQREPPAQPQGDGGGQEGAQQRRPQRSIHRLLLLHRQGQAADASLFLEFLDVLQE